MDLKAEGKERERQVRWAMPGKSIVAPVAEVASIGGFQACADQCAAAGMATGRAAAGRAVDNRVASCSRSENARYG
jgi:hypothetical protein